MSNPYDDPDRRYDRNESEYDDRPRRRSRPWYSKPWLIGLIILGLVGVIFAGIVIRASVRVPNQQIALEEGLTESYSISETAYNQLTTTVLDQYNLAGAKAAKMQEIIKASVVGGAQFGTQGALVNALQQSFPDLSGLNLYDKIADTIASGRARVAAAQGDVFERVRNYLTWRSQWPNVWFVNPVSDVHVVADGDTGMAAIRDMRTPVISQATRDAFTKHTDQPILPTPGASPSGR